MPNILLTTVPKTRINDVFVRPGSKLNFSPVQHPFKDPIIQGRPNIDQRFYADFYRRIGVDIVVETAMHYPYSFITEKTYRPIASGRPFIIFGPYHTLDFLRSLGFLTFSSIIDETYDEITDPEKRFLAACDAVKKFVDRPIECVVKDISGVKSALESNKQTLQNLIKAQITRFIEQIKID